MNPGLLMYLASEGDRQPSREMPELREMGYGGEMRQPMHYPQNDYDGGAESRYRGRDGQWKAGRRPRAYGGDWPMQAMERTPERQHPPMNRYTPTRSEDDGDDEPERKRYGVTIEPQDRTNSDYGRRSHWQPPYAPGMEDNGDYRRNRQIGFGAARMGHDGGSGNDDMMMGGAQGYEDDEPMMLDRETAEEWVSRMQNTDEQRPHGARWTPDQARPIAQRCGIPTDGPDFWEFYAIMNLIYSDEAKVNKEFNMTNPDYYAKRAKAWLDDKDAMPGKAALYYRYIVKK